MDKFGLLGGVGLVAALEADGCIRYSLFTARPLHGHLLTFKCTPRNTETRFRDHLYADR